MGTVLLMSFIAVLLLFLGLAALQPGEFTLSRSILVHASPENCYRLVENFHRWISWSPWESLDPDMVRTYEGPASGAGALYRWSGKKKVGAGTMTLYQCQPPEKLSIQLDFLRPMKATNQIEFTFQSEGWDTRVTWTMRGRKNFFVKALHLVFNMEKMVGPDFEKGLAQLKAAAESQKGK